MFSGILKESKHWPGMGEEVAVFALYILYILCYMYIKFDFNYSKTQIHFLDITITKTTRKLLTPLYRKEIDRQSYLHRKSEHPETLKRSIPYSQALRLKRVCTTKEDFTEQSIALTKRLVERGYNENEILEQTSKTFAIERAHLLNPKS